MVCLARLHQLYGLGTDHVSQGRMMDIFISNSSLVRRGPEEEKGWPFVFEVSCMYFE